VGQWREQGEIRVGRAGVSQVHVDDAHEVIVADQPPLPGGPFGGLQSDPSSQLLVVGDGPRLFAIRRDVGQPAAGQQTANQDRDRRLN